MEIKQFVWDVVDANSWLVTENNHGLLIDAVDNPELYEALQPLESLTIILTHCHFDHICGLNTIRSIRPDCKVITTARCSEHIGNKFRNMSSSATAFMVFYQKEGKPVRIDPFVCSAADSIFDGRMSFSWQDNQVTLSAVYGHTSDGLVATIGHSILFTGDTLLHIPTITRFPTGSKELLRDRDIPLLESLAEKRVYPGHGQPGLLSEMMINAFSQIRNNDYARKARV